MVLKLEGKNLRGKLHRVLFQTIVETALTIKTRHQKEIAAKNKVPEKTFKENLMLIEGTLEPN